MKLKAKPFNKKKLFCVATAIAAIAVVCFFFFYTLFSNYDKDIKQEFDNLLMENLSSYTQAQAQEAQVRIADAQNALMAASILIQTPDTLMDEQWLNTYLDELNKVNPYIISYLTIDSLTDPLPPSEDFNTPIVQKILSGQTVVSEARFSKRMGNQYCFGIVQPVTKGDQVIGALRALMNAEDLIATSQVNSVSRRLDSHLIKTTGQVVLLDKGEGPWNLFSFLPKFDIQKSLIVQIQDDMAAGVNGTAALGIFQGDTLFISYASLDCNDWYIVNFSSGNKAEGYSQAIMQSTLFLTATILLVLLVAGATILFILHQQKKRLKIENQRHKMIAELSSDLIFEYDHKKDKIFLSTKSALLLDIPSIQENYKKKLRQQISNIPLEQADFFDYITSHDCINEEFDYQFSNGARLWISVTTKSILDSEQKQIYTIGTFININDLKEREFSLIDKAQRDSLSGLYNKEAAALKVDYLLQTSKLDGFLFFLDLDHFKQINDTWGHATGDLAITAFSEIFRKQFRQEDILARVGGDEFIAFAVNCSDREVALKKAEALIDGAHKVTGSQLRDLHLSVSIGIARRTPQTSTFAELFTAADQAMYEAKKKGRNAYVFAEE